MERLRWKKASSDTLPVDNVSRFTDKTLKRDRFLRTVIPLYLLFEHDLRANASRLSRGKAATHFSG